MSTQGTAADIANALKPDFECLDQSLDQDASDLRRKYDHIDASLAELRAKLKLSESGASDPGGHL